MLNFLACSTELCIKICSPSVAWIVRSSPDLRDARARNLSAMRSRDSVCLCAARVRPVINNPFKSNRNTHFCGLLCRSGSVPSVRACVCPFCWHSARCDRVRDQRHYARNASTNPLIRCGILIHVCAVAACMSMLFFWFCCCCCSSSSSSYAGFSASSPRNACARIHCV